MKTTFNFSVFRMDQLVHQGIQQSACILIVLFASNSLYKDNYIIIVPLHNDLWKAASYLILAL